MIKAPHIEIDEITLLIGAVNDGHIIFMRIIPYAPSLRRTPARIIDPATGASTCALGNQRWDKYIGILIRNAIDSIMADVKENDSMRRG